MVGAADALVRWREYLVDQQHASYSREEHDVWRDVLSRNADLIAQYRTRLHPSYVDGMRALRLPRRIPRIDQLNDALVPTGWQIVCVDGYIPASAYVGLMSARTFPVSRRIRSAEHIDFAPAPDMVHDILGHLPMLFSSDLREFLRRLALVTTKAKSNALDTEFYDANRLTAELKANRAANPLDIAVAERRVECVNQSLVDHASELTLLRRMYVWSVEFGLIKDHDDFRVLGAALLSAPKEFRFVCDGCASIAPYSLDVVHHENGFSDMLSRYFVARDFSHFHDVLSDFETRMQRDEVVGRDIRSYSNPIHGG
jgi:phenylalanine-4-hydroxylase